MRIVVIDLKETLSAGVFLQNKKKHTQKSENLKGNTPTHIGLQRGNIRGKHCTTKVYFDQGYLLLLVSFVRHYYSFFCKADLWVILVSAPACVSNQILFTELIKKCIIRHCTLLQFFSCNREKGLDFGLRDRLNTKKEEGKARRSLAGSLDKVNRFGRVEHERQT